MTVKEKLHRIVEELPEEEAQQWLRRFEQDRLPPSYRSIIKKHLNALSAQEIATLPPDLAENWDSYNPVLERKL
jgi:hypothetical protein